MPKYEYEFKETLTYTRVMEFETDLPEKEIYDHLENAEKYADDVNDVAYFLKKKGFKVVDEPEDDLTSPDEVEMEFRNLKEIK